MLPVCDEGQNMNQLAADEDSPNPFESSGPSRGLARCPVCLVLALTVVNIVDQMGKKHMYSTRKFLKHRRVNIRWNLRQSERSFSLLPCELQPAL